MVYSTIPAFLFIFTFVPALQSRPFPNDIEDSRTTSSFSFSKRSLIGKVEDDLGSAYDDAAKAVNKTGDFLKTHAATLAGIVTGTAAGVLVGGAAALTLDPAAVIVAAGGASGLVGEETTLAVTRHQQTGQWVQIPQNTTQLKSDLVDHAELDALHMATGVIGTAVGGEIAGKAIGALSSGLDEAAEKTVAAGVRTGTTAAINAAAKSAVGSDVGTALKSVGEELASDGTATVVDDAIDKGADKEDSRSKHQENN